MHIGIKIIFLFFYHKNFEYQVKTNIVDEMRNSYKNLIEF